MDFFTGHLHLAFYNQPIRILPYGLFAVVLLNLGEKPLTKVAPLGLELSPIFFLLYGLCVYPLDYSKRFFFNECPITPPRAFSPSTSPPGTV